MNAASASVESARKLARRQGFGAPPCREAVRLSGHVALFPWHGDDVLRLVVKHGMRLTLTGVTIGIFGALAFTRVLANQLYQVKAADPIALAAVSVLLIAVAAAACYLPARRATKLHPMEALRYE